MEEEDQNSSRQNPNETDEIDQSSCNLKENNNESSKGHESGTPTSKDYFHSKTFNRSERSEKHIVGRGLHKDGFLKITVPQTRERTLRDGLYKEVAGDKLRYKEPLGHPLVVVQKHLPNQYRRNMKKFQHSNPDSKRSGQSNVCRPKHISRIGSRKEMSSKRPSLVIGIEFLKGLLGHEPEYIISELTRSLSSLKECIFRTASDRELLEVLLHLVSEAYTSQSNPYMLISLFQTLKEASFLHYLVAYFVNTTVLMINGESELNDNRLKLSVNHSLSVITKQITRNPSSTSVFRGLHVALGKVIENLKKNGSADDDITSMFDIFSEQIESDRAVLNANSTGRREEKEPPDNFKEYPVSPTANEILGTTKPFLRANRIDGGYKDLHDYLDVQFRLLREDFVGPLREGLTEYKDMVIAEKVGGKLSDLSKLDIKVYKNVRVITPVITQQGICYKLKLEMTPKLQKLNWQFNKRLIFGSLVCLTDNDFEDVLCATVVEREETSISQGYFVVKLEQENLADSRILHRAFVMVETSGYFESYRHVLKKLQKIKNGDLPFEKYIVKCETNVDPPRYLKTSTTYDLRPLVDADVHLYAAERHLNFGSRTLADKSSSFSIDSVHARAVQVSDPEKWPSKESLHMDESQYKAVQTALTKEFAIIQGPPGTGKTYIGLQILKVLLHNKHAWARYWMDNSPILIVCYTNHALDQFLEGIVKFYTGDLLRIGGRSTSKVLEQYNLKTYRRYFWCEDRKDQWRALIQLIKETLHMTKRIELYKTDILSDATLRHEMGYVLYSSLRQGYKDDYSEKRISCIFKWLKIRELQVKCRQLSLNNDKTKETEQIDVQDDAQRRIRELFVNFDELPELQKAERVIQSQIRGEDVSFYVEEYKYINTNDERAIREARYCKHLKAEIIKQITDEEVMLEIEANAIQNIWSLDGPTRWRLYRLWIKNLCSNLYEQVKEKEYEIELASERYQSALKMEDMAIMERASVIGMTTSGAAKYESILRCISPKVVIVEEAAEVLEAHIVSTLSKGCEHLILIGDHKQLRPNPTVYKLAVKYNLEISLFERMIKNGINYNCLDLQHRMRPEISSIMRNIYPDLQDHEHVKTYPSVKGVSSNLFLVNHSHSEKSDEDVRSYSNPQEAEYAVALCRYLILQGYDKSEITVLTTYTGQLMCLRRMMPKKEFEGVKVTVVDNYQGEENEIIILSLVRSNSVDKIGFLNIENRICVALSRAKVGFYLIGNFDHLTAHSDLWKRISVEMKEKEAYGDGLKLHCQNHPVETLIAKTPDDFKGAPEGGCKKKCDIRLECGHKCERYCHITDREHTQALCQKDCLKVLCDLGHTCPDMCFRTCRPCMVPLMKTIPKCGHLQQVPCSTKLESFKCLAPCKQTLVCGHQCRDSCGDSHTVNCNVKVCFTWPCGHSADITCGESGEVKCPKPCRTQLHCKHTCKGTCGSCNGGRIHTPCTEGCQKILICGHKCKSTCNNCPPCASSCQTWCEHRRCQQRCGEQCFPCNEPCSWECEHYQCLKRCSEPCNRPRCNQPCKKRLSCNHTCIGLCGETCPTYCRVCNKSDVCNMNTMLGAKYTSSARFVLLEDCGHIVEYNALDRYMDDFTNKIEFKCCPTCMTPIRRCLRYGEKINTILEDVEIVKHYLIGNYKEKFSSLEKEFVLCNYTDDCNHKERTQKGDQWIKNKVRYTAVCMDQLRPRLFEFRWTNIYTELQIQTIEIQKQLSLNVIDVILNLKDVSRKDEIQKMQQNAISLYENILNSILQPKYVFSEQEIQEYTSELQRGIICGRYLKLRHAIQAERKSTETAAELQMIDNLLFSETNFTNDSKEEIIKRMKRLNNHSMGELLDGLSDERLVSVGLIRPPMSHWFKCRNNHVYGKSGPVSEDMDCPECKAGNNEV